MEGTGVSSKSLTLLSTAPGIRFPRLQSGAATRITPWGHRQAQRQSTCSRAWSVGSIHRTYTLTTGNVLSSRVRKGKCGCGYRRLARGCTARKHPSLGTHMSGSSRCTDPTHIVGPFRSRQWSRQTRREQQRSGHSPCLHGDHSPRPAFGKPALDWWHSLYLVL